MESDKELQALLTILYEKLSWTAGRSQLEEVVKRQTGKRHMSLSRDSILLRVVSYLAPANQGQSLVFKDRFCNRNNVFDAASPSDLIQFSSWPSLSEDLDGGLIGCNNNSKIVSRKLNAQLENIDNKSSGNESTEKDPSSSSSVNGLQGPRKALETHNVVGDGDSDNGVKSGGDVDSDNEVKSVLTNKKDYHRAVKDLKSESHNSGIQHSQVNNGYKSKARRSVCFMKRFSSSDSSDSDDDLQQSVQTFDAATRNSEDDSEHHIINFRKKKTRFLRQLCSSDESDSKSPTADFFNNGEVDTRLSNDVIDDDLAVTTFTNDCAKSEMHNTSGHVPSVVNESRRKGRRSGFVKKISSSDSSDLDVRPSVDLLQAKTSDNDASYGQTMNLQRKGARYMHCSQKSDDYSPVEQADCQASCKDDRDSKSRSANSGDSSEGKDLQSSVLEISSNGDDDDCDSGASGIKYKVYSLSSDDDSVIFSDHGKSELSFSGGRSFSLCDGTRLKSRRSVCFAKQLSLSQSPNNKRQFGSTSEPSTNISNDKDGGDCESTGILAHKDHTSSVASPCILTDYDRSYSNDVEQDENDEVFNKFVTSWRPSRADSENESESGMEDFIVDDGDDDADSDSSIDNSSLDGDSTGRSSPNCSGIASSPFVSTKQRGPKRPLANFSTPHSSVTNRNRTEFKTPKSSVNSAIARINSAGLHPPGTPAYKRQFNKDKDKIVKELFALYNSTVFGSQLPTDMSITWNKRMTKTAGFCYYSSVGPEKQRKCRIELSEKVIDSADRIRDTLIHELCHAASWIVNGDRNGHGAIWKAWARKANKTHPELPIVMRCHAYEISTKYNYRCNGCGQTYGRHSKSIDSSRHRCSRCGGIPELVTNTPSRTPSRYNLFIKDNYSAVKRANPGVSHGDLMKKLGQQFHDALKLNSDEKKEVLDSSSPC